MNKIKFIKNITIVKEEAESDLMLIKATGIVDLNTILTPVLVPSVEDSGPTKDGIYELDFILDKSAKSIENIELEVDVIFRIDKSHSWIKGIKINAEENSDIELL